MEEIKIKKVAVIGAGQMGACIGLDFARAGLEVALWNRTPEGNNRAMAVIRHALDTMVEAELITPAEAENTHALLHPTANMDEAAAGAGYLVESVSEKLDLKHEVFRYLDQACPPPAILATNTSTLRPSTIAEATEHPERVVVAHYFFPPHLIPLVEIVGGQKTSQETLDTTFQLLTKARKKPIILLKETASFAGNRIQSGISREASWLVENGVCTPQMVDTVIMMGLGRRMAMMGYFDRIDLNGLDLRADIYRAKGEAIPAYFQERLDRGELGAKTGKGFYDWNPGDVEKLRYRLEMELIRQLKQDYAEGRL